MSDSSSTNRAPPQSRTAVGCRLAAAVNERHCDFSPTEAAPSFQSSGQLSRLTLFVRRSSRKHCPFSFAISKVFSASRKLDIKTHWLSSSPFHQCGCTRKILTLQSSLPVLVSVATIKLVLPSPLAEYRAPSCTTGGTGFGATRFAKLCGQPMQNKATTIASERLFKLNPDPAWNYIFFGIVYVIRRLHSLTL